MFRRKRDEEEFSDFSNMPWDADLSPRDSRGQKVLLWLVGLVVLGATAAGVYWLLRGSLFDSPARAAEQWLNALVQGDADRMLDLTCGKYVQTASVVGLPELIGGGAVEELGVADWLRDIEFDLGNLNYDAADDPAGTSVTVSGALRVRAFGDFWLPVPLNQRWRMVEEDNTWKWCGFAP
jgi:hypothetical protein